VEINRTAAQIARKACDKFETPGRPRYVIGSVGPGTKIITLGKTTWEIMEESFFEQIRGLLEGGADVLLIETQQDLLAIKCAISAANKVSPRHRAVLPIMVQASMDQQNGQQMLTGSDATALVAAMMPFDEVDVLGLNCAFGPYELTETIRVHLPDLAALGQRFAQRGFAGVCEQQGAFPDAAARFHQRRDALRRGIRRKHRRADAGGTTVEHLTLLCEAVGIRPQKKAIALAQAAGVEPHQAPLISDRTTAT